MEWKEQFSGGERATSKGQQASKDEDEERGTRDEGEAGWPEKQPEVGADRREKENMTQVERPGNGRVVADD